MTARRRRVEYIDPYRLHPPGHNLKDDGTYRRRAGWPQAPRTLTKAEIALLPDHVLDPPYELPEEHEPVRFK